VLAEALVLWLLLGVVAVATFVTYTRTPVRDLYHVSSVGPAAGFRLCWASRASRRV
jgi:hypothetical protein